MNKNSFYQPGRYDCCVTYLGPVHFASGECDADAHSNGGDGECTPDRCNSTLSRGAGRAGSRFECSLTLAAHFHKTIPLAPDTYRCHITLSPWARVKRMRYTWGWWSMSAPLGLRLTAPVSSTASRVVYDLQYCLQSRVRPTLLIAVRNSARRRSGRFR